MSFLFVSSFFFEVRFRCGFRLPQRSHLRTLKNFVNEKSEKRCKKSGKYWIKSGNGEILRRFIFFLYPRLRFEIYHLVDLFTKLTGIFNVVISIAFPIPRLIKNSLKKLLSASCYVLTVSLINTKLLNTKLRKCI